MFYLVVVVSLSTPTDWVCERVAVPLVVPPVLVSWICRRRALPRGCCSCSRGDGLSLSLLVRRMPLIPGALGLAFGLLRIPLRPARLPPPPPPHRRRRRCAFNPKPDEHREMVATKIADHVELLITQFNIF